ncbi:MAG TPA: hypothetical protein VFV98_13240 [Vicinamibacterales bacterium]|nr:hypothetical protein [Vicinamibacterales bacterium]
MNAPPRDVRRRELGGPDPIDRRLGSPPPSPLIWLLSLLRTRSALGLAPSLTPAVIFLPVGALFGPSALGLISPRLIAGLDFAVTIALAVLGVLVGIALGREIRSAAWLFVAASLESAMTIAVVAGATAYFVQSTGAPIGAPIAAFALALGLCASASSATSAHPDSEPVAAVATRVADLDDVLPIVIAVAAFAIVPTTAPEQQWTLAIAPIVVGLASGAVGWLLFERAESTAERAVYVLGVLALTGGAAAALRVSPLAAGLIAGLCWTVAPGRADRIVQDDLSRVQHPLIVLLLVTAGAMWVPSQVAVWLLAPYLLCRLAGKVIGAWVSSRLVDVRASDLAAYLISPGVLAVAFALNFRQMLPTAAGEVLLSTVTTGTALFELFALAIVPHWRSAK